jgi:hypothetical protein
MIRGFSVKRGWQLRFCLLIYLVLHKPLLQLLLLLRLIEVIGLSHKETAASSLWRLFLRIL